MREDWPESPLGEAVELGKGGSWGADSPAPGLTEAFCLRGMDLAELINGIRPDAPRRWLKESELSKSRCKPDMVLIETSGSKCGRSLVLTTEMLAQFELPVVYSNFCRTLKIDTSKLSSSYAELWFSHNYWNGVIPSYRATSAMPNLDVKSLLRMETLLIPPFEIQQRTVDLVSAVDSYVAALQQQADAARSARSAVIEQVLVDGGDTWGNVSMGEVLEIARGGSPRPIHAYITTSDDGVNWIKIGDAATHDKYIYATSQKIRPEGINKSRRVFPGDFLLSNSMSFGRPYILRTDGCIHDGWLLLSGISKHFDEDYLYNVLMSNRVQQQFNSLAAGSGVRNLNIDVASEVHIPLPPIDIQKEIGSLANSFDALVLSTEQTLAIAIELRAGVVSELLSGAHEIPESYDRLLGAA